MKQSIKVVPLLVAIPLTLCAVSPALAQPPTQTAFVNTGVTKGVTSTTYVATDPVSATVAAGTSIDDLKATAPATVPAQIGTQSARQPTNVTWDWSGFDTDILSAAGTATVAGTAADGNGSTIPALLTVIVEPLLDASINVCTEPGTTITATFSEKANGAWSTCDGDPTTNWSNWSSTPRSSDSLTYGFARNYKVNQLTVSSTESAAHSLTVQYQDNSGTWHDTSAGVVAGLSTTTPTVVNFDPVMTRGIRITFDSSSSYTKVAEVAISGQKLQDSSIADLGRLLVNQTSVPNFATNTPNYTTTADLKPTVTAYPLDQNATVSVRQATADNRTAVVTVTAADGATKKTFNVTISNWDAIAPVVVANVTPSTPDGSNGWYTSVPTVAGSASDDSGQPPTIQYSLDNGSWSPYTAPVSTGGEGKHTVSIRATDGWGNTANVITKNLMIDTTAPNATGSYDSSSRTVHLNASDDASGVSRIEYKLGTASTWTVYTADVSMPNTATLFSYRAVDVAGHVGTVSSLNVPEKPYAARVAGADRYATSAAISAATFKAGVDVVYVAGGTSFPDAISAAPAAGSKGAPVLLVTPTAVPQQIQKELQRLKPKRIVIAGGTGVVSDSVAKALKKYTSGSVTRVSGNDRYATSAALSAATFSSNVDIAYVSTGTDFPDALSGAPVAGKNKGPVLLIGPNGISPSVRKELTRLSPNKIVILGGTGAISNQTARELQQFGGGQIQRQSGADRFATSAQISRSNFNADAAVVYVANGDSFPDALSGAPAAAANGAPVLLLSSSGISEEVKTELVRLNPRRIVILGGTGVISDAVAKQLDSYLTQQ